MKLRNFREKRRRISQTQAASELEVERSTYWRWENGKSIPLPAQIERVREWSKGAVTANDFISKEL